MVARPALLVACAVTAVTLLASLPAAAETAPEPPPPPPPTAPLAPVAVPVAPPPLERRSQPALTGGITGVSMGGILLVSGALAGGLQAACPGTCHHTPTAIGLAAVGGTLIAVGIPLILWGGRLVPVAGPTPALALMPRRSLPAWAGAPASEGWAFRF